MQSVRSNSCVYVDNNKYSMNLYIDSLTLNFAVPVFSTLLLEFN